MDYMLQSSMDAIAYSKQQSRTIALQHWWGKQFHSTKLDWWTPNAICSTSNRHFPKFLAISLTETYRLSPFLEVWTSTVSHFSRRCHPLGFRTAVVQEVIKDLQICKNLPSWCARCRVFMWFLWVWSGVNGGRSWRWCCKGVWNTRLRKICCLWNFAIKELLHRVKT